MENGYSRHAGPSWGEPRHTSVQVLWDEPVEEGPREESDEGRVNGPGLLGRVGRQAGRHMDDGRSAARFQRCNGVILTDLDDTT